MLMDFGVQLQCQCDGIVDGLLRLVFDGHFGREGVGNKPPSLVVLVDETQYCHFYGMLPCFVDQQDKMMNFTFELKENGRFGPQHIEWLEEYKRKTVQENGHFVSIVNVYNFYHDAVKLLMKMSKKNH